MEWTREARYQRLAEVSKDVYQKLVTQVADSPYRQKFHVQPKTGLLNDPNGFSFYKGRYHLFYQWFPLGPVHGVKYWYHMSSENLVDWQDEGIALEPDSFYDSHGVFSGSGLVVEDQLHLFYTGNTRTDDWVRIPYQCHAIMDASGNIVKADSPLISDSPAGFTDNFRDPKVFEYQGHYLALIGAETSEHRGKVVYYKSDNLKDWEYQGIIGTKPYPNAGFMWECPDYFEQDGQGVLLFSPQGMQAEGDRFQNIFQSGYLLGAPIDFQTGQFDHGAFQELDKGFDFYAPQTMQDPLGRRLLVGWLGLPGVDCVTDDDGWAHCLTLPRELVIENNHLYQRPIPELKALRKAHHSYSGDLHEETIDLQDISRTYELKLKVTAEELEHFALTLRKGHGEETVFSYDHHAGKLELDLRKSGKTVTAEYGRTRSCDFQAEYLELHLFLDESSLEIFVNDGHEVFTSRLFSHQDANGIQLTSKGKASYVLDLWEV